MLLSFLSLPDAPSVSVLSTSLSCAGSPFISILHEAKDPPAGPVGHPSGPLDLACLRQSETSLSTSGDAFFIFTSGLICEFYVSLL